MSRKISSAKKAAKKSLTVKKIRRAAVRKKPSSTVKKKKMSAIKPSTSRISWRSLAPPLTVSAYTDFSSDLDPRPVLSVFELLLLATMALALGVAVFTVLNSTHQSAAIVEAVPPEYVLE